MRKLTALFSVLAVIGAVFAVQAFAASSVAWKVGSKKTISIRRGGSVKWVWSDNQTHNVHGPGFTSKLSSKKGFTFTRRFTKRGTFTIICQVHPKTMKTVVRVS
jgi:plastocyanin